MQRSPDIELSGADCTAAFKPRILVQSPSENDTVHGKRLPLVALASNDGFYLGTADGEATVTQESTESFASAQLALEALASGSWTQRAKA